LHEANQLKKDEASRGKRYFGEEQGASESEDTDFKKRQMFNLLH
jgi:hypothetical protein